jgi:putative flippase GtrA
VTRKDIIASVVLGLITAGISYGLAVFWALPPWMLSWLRLSFVLAPLGALAVVGLGQHLRKQWPAAVSAGRFSVVGAANTLIDLGLLNLCIFATGVLAGPLFALFKAGSFTGAVVHSYCWNANWSFADSENQNSPAVGGHGKRFGLFLAVTLIGLWVNTSVAALVVYLGSPSPFLAGLPWANLAAVLALALSTLWNFFAYRFLVFSPHRSKVSQEVVGAEAVGD